MAESVSSDSQRVEAPGVSVRPTDALREAVARTRKSLPGLAVDDETLVAYVAARLPGDDGSEAADGADRAAGGDGSSEGVELEDLLLACGCVERDPEALRLVEARFGSAIHAAAARICKNASSIEEVVQQVRVKLFVADGGPPRIAAYAGRGPLRAWLQVATTRTALSLLRSEDRRRESQSSDRDLADVLPTSDHPELDHIRQRYRAEFRGAFRAALESLSARERTVLRYYLLDQLNIEQIGAIYGTHRATIARWIARSREKLLEETRTHLMARLRIAQTDFESIMRLVRSQLDVSIETFLRTPVGDETEET